MGLRKLGSTRISSDSPQRISALGLVIAASTGISKKIEHVVVNYISFYLVKVKGIVELGKFAKVVINDKVSITLRPDKALLMAEAGHYEIDTIYGKDQESFLLTIVDIATLYTIIIKLENKEAQTVEKALIKLFD